MTVFNEKENFRDTLTYSTNNLEMNPEILGYVINFTFSPWYYKWFRVCWPQTKKSQNKTKIYICKDSNDISKTYQLKKKKLVKYQRIT